MKRFSKIIFGIIFSLVFCLSVTTCSYFSKSSPPDPIFSTYGIFQSQIPKWTPKDLEFFLYGSMSSEFIPERVLWAFMKTYPNLFPGNDLSAYGVIYSKENPWPMGFSRRRVQHLGDQISVGINCAACHLGEVYQSSTSTPVRVLGKASQFNVYTFFGAVALSMAETTQPNNMERYLKNLLNDPGAQKLLDRQIKKQRKGIRQLLATDPFGSKGINSGELHEISAEGLQLNRYTLEAEKDLVVVIKTHLQLFHNIRTALHLPEELPPPVPTLPGPGRTDAFGVLAAAFFNFPTKMQAPVKFGIPWNLKDRKWAHWDGNNDKPLARNLGAALGLGTPLVKQGKLVNFNDIKRHTHLTEAIRAPRYPWAINLTVAERGKILYEANCVTCHNVSSENRRLFSPEDVGTDPNRALFFDEQQANLLNHWVASLEVRGYRAPKKSFRSTQKYWAYEMDGVWARSPYLHNGSVRTLRELLMPPDKRPKTFRVGSRVYDVKHLGFKNDGNFIYDTNIPGNSNSGHDYGTKLSQREKEDLIEFLKTL